MTPRPRAPRPGRRTFALMAAFALLAVYAVPAFAPPSPMPPAPPPADAALLARLFPGVPASWVLLRLAALALGAGLAAWAVARPPPVRAPGFDASPVGPAAEVPVRFAGAALAIAGAHALLALGASRLSRTGQLAHLLLLAIPPLILAIGQRRSAGVRRLPVFPRGPVVVAAMLAAGWFAYRFSLAWHSPRVADAIDLWHSFGWLTDAVSNERNLLLATGQPGVGNAYMLLLGAPLLGPDGFAMSLGWVQIAHAGWLFAATVGFAALAAALLERTAAVVATATFLASPFVLLMPYSPSPFGIFLALGIASLLLLVALRATGSPAALAALGAVAGLGTTTAYLYPWVLVAALAGAAIAWTRRPRLSGVACGTALLVFFAAAWPGLPGVAELHEMSADYVERQGQWASLESMLLGQRSPFAPVVVDGEVTPIWVSGRRAWMDVPIGSLLAPFAVPRSAFRLWGDALFDPLGAALAAVGLASCAFSIRRSPGARLLLALLVVAILPASLASAYDRASLTRNLLLPVPIALLAGAGFGLLRRTLGIDHRPRLVTAAAVVAILTSGALLFDGVNPRILPASSLGLSVEAIGATPPAGGATLLDYGRPQTLDWLHTDRIGRFLPRHPIATRVYEGPRSLYTDSGSLAGEILLWSPALERDEQVARVLCERWPRTVLFEFVDRAGLSRALAARPAAPPLVDPDPSDPHPHEPHPNDPGWQPALPPARWIAVDCRAEAIASGPLAKGRAPARVFGGPRKRSDGAAR